MKKRILSAVLAFVLVIGACFAVNAAETAEPLRFDENGEFKIMHLTDCQDDYPAETKMLKFIDAALKEYQPDIVVLGGDNSVGPENMPRQDKENAIKELCDIFVANETYFTLVFGNHDHQQGYSDDEQLVMYQNYGGKYCLAYDADPELTGTATHTLPVLGSKTDKTEFMLYMFDSNEYVSVDGKSEYDCVNPDQIEWYKETSKSIEAQEGKKIPALAFQHIVVGDVYDALFFESSVDMGVLTPKYNGKIYSFLPRTNNFTGFLLEFPCPGYYNYGQFDAMAERGDIIGIFSGHDHINTYETELKGIKIINTAGATFDSYGKEMTRGMRMITVKESNTWDFESESVTINGFALENKEFANDAGIISVFAMITEGLAKVMLALGEFSGIFAGIIDLIA
ncbi:MAG: metallophosphoesterase [Clostridia bacterium]|nr:metallophosphoesterase [Clostridia bacterium]